MSRRINITPLKRTDIAVADDKTEIVEISQDGIYAITMGASSHLDANVKNCVAISSTIPATPTVVDELNSDGSRFVLATDNAIQALFVLQNGIGLLLTKTDI